MNITRSASVALQGEPEAGGVTVRAWPNPTVGRLTVSIEGAAVTEARLSVVDVLGREVVASTHPLGTGRPSVRLDVSALPAGVYVVRVEAGGETATARVTVVR